MTNTETTRGVQLVEDWKMANDHRLGVDREGDYPIPPEAQADLVRRIDAAIERGAVTEALAALDALVDAWAAEVGLDGMGAAVAGNPEHVMALIRQAFIIEGAYRGHEARFGPAVEPIPERYACDRCGRRDGLDCVIPNHLWNQIAAECHVGVLCVWCLDAECARRGWTVRALLAFNGRAISAGTDPLNDDGHWERHLGDLTARAFEAERAKEAADAERDALIRTCADWHRKYDEDTAALKAERDRWYGKAIERAARINAMRDVLEMFARIEVPHDATDGTRVATTHYCHHQVTAYMIRQAREAIDSCERQLSQILLAVALADALDAAGPQVLALRPVTKALIAYRAAREGC